MEFDLIETREQRKEMITTQDFQNALNGVYYTLGSYRFLGRDVLAIGDAPTDITSHSVATSHFYDIFRYQILDTNSYTLIPQHYYKIFF